MKRDVKSIKRFNTSPLVDPVLAEGKLNVGTRESRFHKAVAVVDGDDDDDEDADDKASLEFSDDEATNEDEDDKAMGLLLERAGEAEETSEKGAETEEEAATEAERPLGPAGGASSLLGLAGIKAAAA